MNRVFKGFNRSLWLCVLIAGPVVASAQPVPFETVPASLQEVSREHIFDAVIEAVQESTVSAQTSGRILAVYFDVDDYVPKGGVLLRFKDTEHRARLEQAQASLKEAAARNEEAQDQFERMKDLFAEKHVSKSDMDRARADVSAAKARLDAAQAGVKQAREQLAYTEVRAPYSGIVSQRHAEPGESVNVGQPLMTGFSLEKLRAATVVPQNLIDDVRAQALARIIITPQDDRSIFAEKLTFTPYADSRTHTFKVRVDLPEGEHGIYPGTFVKVAFITGRERRLVIPASAVAYRSEVRGVYVVEESGRVSFRQVRLGRSRGERIEILAGLEAGEQVASDPVRAAVYFKSTQAGSDQ